MSNFVIAFHFSSNQFPTGTIHGVLQQFVLSALKPNTDFSEKWQYLPATKQWRVEVYGTIIPKPESESESESEL